MNERENALHSAINYLRGADVTAVKEVFVDQRKPGQNVEEVLSICMVGQEAVP